MIKNNCYFKSVEKSNTGDIIRKCNYCYNNPYAPSGIVSSKNCVPCPYYVDKTKLDEAVRYFVNARIKENNRK